ncbi:MAG: thermonuclease family protein, partial [Actinomycetota bacterium]
MSENMARMPPRMPALAAAVALSLALVPTAGATVVTGTGIRAVDGDTALVRIKGKPVRVDLAGVAAPAAGDCFAATAKRRLQAFVAGRRLRVDTRAARIGTRVNALLSPAGKGPGDAINLALVKAGLAEVTTTRRLPIARQLDRAEIAAQTAGKGLWGTGCDTPGPGTRTPPPPSTPPPPPPAAPAAPLTV